jgi:hypothetical protein
MPVLLKVPPERMKNFSRVVSESLQTAFSTPTAAEVEQIKDIEHIFALPVSCVSAHGYLVFSATPSLGSLHDLSKKFFEVFKRKLSEVNEQLQSDGQIIEVSIPKTDFVKHAQDHADFLYLDQLDKKQVAVGFWAMKQLPHIEKTQHAGFLAIEKKYLIPNGVLIFDLYLALDKNHKMLLYKKSGSVVKGDFLAKLEQSKPLHLCIKEDQVSAYLQFCAMNRVISKAWAAIEAAA